jgi:DNA helicase-2/ATP-dependent DNA helicase PcrA
LVLAGPGAGKTRVIIARVGHLIMTGTPASRIVVITFTKRAAKEIFDRLREQLGKAADGVRASTFHAFCMALIHKYGELLGTKKATVIDPDDVSSLFKLIRSSLKDKKLPKASDAAKVYSYARNTTMRIAEACAAQDVDEDHVEGIIQLCKLYEERKRLRNYIDFDDILVIICSAMERDANIKALIKRQMDFVLVDEFQDTNPLQWRLLNQIRDPVNMFCVGDPKQSIYKFRGADIENILGFADRVENSTVLALDRNFRSTQEILDLSNWLLERSPVNYLSGMVAVRGSGLKPVLREFSSDWEESEWMAEDIVIRKLDGAKLSDHMILVRSAFAGRAIERALLAKDIPYRYIGGTKLLESAHVRSVLSILRVISNHRDDLGWMRLLQLFPKIGEVTSERISNEFVSLPSLERCCESLRKAGRGLDAVADIFVKIGSGSQAPSAVFMAAAEALQPVLEVTYRNDGWDMRKRDFPVVAKLAAKHASISEFIEEYLLAPVSTSEVQQKEDDDAVTLITIHSSKGLEKPVCYMPAMNPGAYPHSRSLHSDDEIEEERRVVYVGMTRAMNELILTRSVRSFSTDGDANQSYFLNELPDELVEFIPFDPAAGMPDFRNSVF